MIRRGRRICVRLTEVEYQRLMGMTPRPYGCWTITDLVCKAIEELISSREKTHLERANAQTPPPASDSYQPIGQREGDGDDGTFPDEPAKEVKKKLPNKPGKSKPAFTIVPSRKGKTSEKGKSKSHRKVHAERDGKGRV